MKEMELMMLYYFSRDSVGVAMTFTFIVDDFGGWEGRGGKYIYWGIYFVFFIRNVTYNSSVFHDSIYSSRFHTENISKRCKKITLFDFLRTMYKKLKPCVAIKDMLRYTDFLSCGMVKMIARRISREGKGFSRRKNAPPPPSPEMQPGLLFTNLIIFWRRMSHWRR